MRKIVRANTIAAESKTITSVPVNIQEYVAASKNLTARNGSCKIEVLRNSEGNSILLKQIKGSCKIVSDNGT